VAYEYQIWTQPRAGRFVVRACIPNEQGHKSVWIANVPCDTPSMNHSIVLPAVIIILNLVHVAASAVPARVPQQQLHTVCRSYPAP
jgi:hypothetical protein